MGIFDKIGSFISSFKDAVKAGNDFNPLLKEVMDEIEQLHSEGKLSDVIYQAEQTYETEHDAYTAKGTHTDAADSKGDVEALAHFMKTLSTSDGLPEALKEKAGKLSAMKEEMQKALGPLGKFL